jgi:ribosomal protein L37AE/L43A
LNSYFLFASGLQQLGQQRSAESVSLYDSLLSFFGVLIASFFIDCVVYLLPILLFRFFIFRRPIIATWKAVLVGSAFHFCGLIALGWMTLVLCMISGDPFDFQYGFLDGCFAVANYLILTAGRNECLKTVSNKNEPQTSVVDRTPNTLEVSRSNETKCPECGIVLRADSRFCPKCGNRVVPPIPDGMIICPKCGNTVSDSKYCTECGNNLSNPSARN